MHNIFKVLNLNDAGYATLFSPSVCLSHSCTMLKPDRTRCYLKERNTEVN